LAPNPQELSSSDTVSLPPTRPPQHQPSQGPGEEPGGTCPPDFRPQFARHQPWPAPPGWACSEFGSARPGRAPDPARGPHPPQVRLRARPVAPRHPAEGQVRPGPRPPAAGHAGKSGAVGGPRPTPRAARLGPRIQIPRCQAPPSPPGPPTAGGWGRQRLEQLGNLHQRIPPRAPAEARP
jgi:hypothetical protein